MSLDEPEFWLASVFCSPEASGNATGVIFDTGKTPDDCCQETARQLGLPDTVFLDRIELSREWNARTFSPFEKISFCVQTLLAAHSVLQVKPSGKLVPESRFKVGERTVSVISDSAQPGTAWLTIPEQQITAVRDPMDLSPAMAISSREFPALLVDAGRKRIYQLIPRDLLYSIKVEPSRVMQFCTDRKIHGICLMALTNSREIALRVFTTSLGGREDIATGGAAAGLLTYLEQVGVESPAFHSIWTVHQGSGPKHTRGTLYVRRLDDGKDVAVGGSVRLRVRGNLCGDLTVDHE